MQNIKKLKDTRKLVYLSLLTSLALILFIFESMIPMPVITPGAKLGLANLIIMVSIYTLDSYKDALKVLLLRIFIVSLFFGTPSMIIYSLSGGLLSFGIMIFLKKFFGKHLSLIGISVSGAVFHNIGQLFAACLILENFGVMLYLPVLSLAGIGTGVFVGISADFMIKHLNKLLYK
ncbi:Gx transporter family protein [uncultured Clostridium sp.]|jgi:heptaprenyl diphosphate synthase|uniref:Gx transporter family protein n=1 Tax=uncultured Clostridium sp. TaxID=59620 RepID=UPI002607A4AA|nr:Gx transporter family protein [uncultured Clostridium sp.]